MDPNCLLNSGNDRAWNPMFRLQTTPYSCNYKCLVANMSLYHHPFGLEQAEQIHSRLVQKFQVSKTPQLLHPWNSHQKSCPNVWGETTHFLNTREWPGSINWKARASVASTATGKGVKETKHSLQNSQRYCMINHHHEEHKSFEDSMARSPAPGFGWNESQNSSFEDSMARSPAPGFGRNESQNSSFEDSMARSRSPGFGWNTRQNSSFEDSMARSPAPGFGWTESQNSSFEDLMAMSPAPGFGWNTRQNSSFEDLMAMSPAPGFGWTTRQNSSFEDSMARSPAPGFGWNTRQNSTFEDSMARSPAPGFG